MANTHSPSTCPVCGRDILDRPSKQNADPEMNQDRQARPSWEGWTGSDSPELEWPWEMEATAAEIIELRKRETQQVDFTADSKERS